MPRGIFQTLWTAVPVFCALFFTSVTAAAGQGYVSLFWALIFGLSDCLFIWIPYSLAHPSPFFEIAAFGWPALVAVFLYWISGVVWDSLREPGRWIAIGVLVFLCSPIVTLKRAEQAPFNFWPTYRTVIASLW